LRRGYGKGGHKNAARHSPGTALPDNQGNNQPHKFAFCHTMNTFRSGTREDESAHVLAADMRALRLRNFRFPGTF